MKRSILSICLTAVLILTFSQNGISGGKDYFICDCCELKKLTQEQLDRNDQFQKTAMEDEEFENMQVIESAPDQNKPIEVTSPQGSDSKHMLPEDSESKIPSYAGNSPGASVEFIQKDDFTEPLYLHKRFIPKGHRNKFNLEQLNKKDLRLLDKMMEKLLRDISKSKFLDCY